MITNLQIVNFRNFEHISIEPTHGLNIIYGKNASGKTSLLEAIYFLGTGHSFRSHHIHQIIKNNADQLTLFCKINNNDAQSSLGIEKNRAGLFNIRINQENAHSAAELAKKIPLQIVTPHHKSLLEDGPQAKRKFIDWGVFHVEHDFIEHWKRYHHGLKQRNAALKTAAHKNEVSIWDQELNTSSKKIDEARKYYLESFVLSFNEIIKKILPNIDFKFKLHSGWETKLDLPELWEKNYKKDLAMGFTQYGPHRADIIMLANNHPIKEVLSRGQQKLFVYALKISQGELLARLTLKNCIYLIDDIEAELDTDNQEKIIALLLENKSQIFATVLQEDKLSMATASKTKIFSLLDAKITSL